MDVLADAIQELFIAMSARYKHGDTLAIGVGRRQLLQAADINAQALDSLLEQLREKAAVLGVEVVEYVYKGDTWYAIRSNYVCPGELNDDEEAVLAVVIEGLEALEDPVEGAIPLAVLKKRLVAGKYLSSHQLERVLRQLEYMGYIGKNRRGISYCPRTLLEFSADARKHIAEESGKLIF